MRKELEIGTIITSEKEVIQIVRFDDIFECGKGIQIMWPNCGSTMIPVTGKRNCGLDFFKESFKRYGINLPEYKIEQVWWKIMSMQNYDQINIKLK